MKKTLSITLMTILSGFVLGLACSIVGTMGYVVAAQGQPADTSLPPPTATPLPEATATPLPTSLPVPDSVDTTDAKSEYYRAIFDVCMYSAQKVEVPREKAVAGCHLFTRQTMKQKWFEEPSQEWEWPLPAIEMPAGPSA